MVSPMGVWAGSMRACALRGGEAGPGRLRPLKSERGGGARGRPLVRLAASGGTGDANGSGWQSAGL